MKKKAVVLLSGGLDSTITLYLAKNQGFDIYALSFNYGQRHNRELEAAKIIAQKAGVVDHQIVSISLNNWGGSSLTDMSMEIENGNVDRTDIPATYVPARNMVFLSIAASLAEAVQARDIFIGVSQVDYSGYVDCRELFIKSMESAIHMGTVMGAEKGMPIRIQAPFINKNKSEEIKIGMEIGADLSDTWSCYNGGERPCGTCDSCLLRKKAFLEAGYDDPSL
ncbi:MAG: 7-cyano-7-deazaguanine synthase QueC [Marinilabiliaceae bacterium]|nr:7-cyano-7-deazaguanine synthase QueC [Marinilabiliaceae bacterium]